MRRTDRTSFSVMCRVSQYLKKMLSYGVFVGNITGNFWLLWNKYAIQPTDGTDAAT